MMSNEKKIFLLVLLLLILFALGIPFLRTLKTSNQAGQTPVRTQEKPKPYISIKSQDNQRLYKKNEQITLLLSASAFDTRISGFDVSLTYDANAFTYIKNVSLQPEFSVNVSQVTASPSKKRLLITGFVSPEKTTLPLLSDTVLLSVTFIANADSQTVKPFVVEYTKGELKDSNLIDEQSNDVLGEVKNSPFMVYFQKAEITLTKDEIKTIDDKLTLQLTSLEIPDENCNDCITSATVDIVNLTSGEKKTITFESGGIAGLMNLSGNAFSYEFGVKTISKNQLILRYGR